MANDKDKEYWDKIRKQMREQKESERLDAIERRKRNEAIEEAARKGDKEFEDIGKELFGEAIADIEKGIRDLPTDEETAEALRIFNEARKKAEGGFLSSGDPAAAAAHIKKNKGKIDKANKKRDKGCAVIAIFLLILGASVLGLGAWGAVEVISALN